MSYIAEVIHLNDIVEEEVTLKINGIELMCFISSCPYQIKENEFYPIEIKPVVFNEYSIHESLELHPVISLKKKVRNDFSYTATGLIKGNRFDLGNIVLEDDVLLRDFGNLTGSTVVWEIDRIDVDFL